jgi:F-type H+-transporting ATPase subunit epsilon
MPPSLMRLKVLLPFQVFADEAEVSRIVAETAWGSFGLLPHRLDCVAALAPGILSFSTPARGERCLAVDEGVLVKAGAQVLVSVRRAFWGSDPAPGQAADAGDDLARLRDAVTRAFVDQDAQAISLRKAMSKVESGFMRRFMRFEQS